MVKKIDVYYQVRDLPTWAVYLHSTTSFKTCKAALANVREMYKNPLYAAILKRRLSIKDIDNSRFKANFDHSH